MKQKIYTLESLKTELQSHRTEGKTIVLCHGVFDLMHIGHLRYFNQAAQMGDILVVTLTQDQYVNKGPGRPAFTESLRAEVLSNISCIDYVAINEWPTAIETIQCLRPNVYVKGPDYKDASKDLTGNIKKEADAVLSVGGEIRFTEDITFSSSRLLVDFSTTYSEAQRSYIHQLRNKYNMGDILSWFDEMKTKKVLLLGEIIVDEYVQCKALGKSGKEPVLVVKQLEEQKFMGGILAIANHLSQFCSEISILSYLGENREYEDLIRSNLSPNVELNAIAKKGAPTIHKKRYIDEYSKARILGVYDIEGGLIDHEEEELLLQRLRSSIKDYDLVLIADYGHGLISSNIVQYVCEHAPYLAINTQINASNRGFHTISKYPRADFVCIHEGELRHDHRNITKPVEELMINLYEKMQCQEIIITQGKNGLIGYSQEEGVMHCPAFAHKVVDRVGAGDTVLSMTSLSLSTGMPRDISLILGNLAGAQSVSMVCNEGALNRNLMLKSLKSIIG